MGDTIFTRIGKKGFGDTSPKDDNGNPLTLRIKLDQAADPYEPEKQLFNAPQPGARHGDLKIG